MKQDKIIAIALTLVALSAISGLLLITLFIFKEGLPIILRVGPANFFLSTTWAPSEGHFGILSMIVGSAAVMVGAMIIGLVFSLACAIVLTQFCPKTLVAFLKPCIELLAGIPSVVYGFMGVVTLIPLISYCNNGRNGSSVLAASIVLGIMVLPTVTSIAIDAFQSVPRSYPEGSIALGATRWQTTRMVMIPAARSGIVAAVILGMGRAIGETMAVIMVAGNALAIPTSPFSPVRTLTSNIALEMGYATGDHQKALFATGLTLFVIIMILNSIALAVSRRRARAGVAS
jgi:phosphate ABC transporter permease protein PstC